MYKGLPYESLEYIPESAYNLLLNEDKLDDKTKDELIPYVVKIDSSNVSINEGTQEEHEGTQDNIEGSAIVEIKGKTTVQDLINYGVSLEAIEDTLGTKVKNNNLTIKEIAESEGKSFSEVKNKLLELLKN